jgi:hypothetical protein
MQIPENAVEEEKKEKKKEEKKKRRRRRRRRSKMLQLVSLGKEKQHKAGH